jgi:phage FluMu protein Com
VKSIDLKTIRISPPNTAARRMVPSGDQCRCTCGSMLARMVRDGLELKCRKCKNLILITHEELIEMYKELNATPPGLPGSAKRP